MAYTDHIKYLTVFNHQYKKRYGENFDGGYVTALLEDSTKKFNTNTGEPYIYDCYISAGIANEESFTRDFLKDHKNLNEYNTFAIDGSINCYPYNYTNNISFIRKMINSTNDENNTNIHYLLDNYNDIFLKIDIEGGEYPWVNSLSLHQLNSLKQIVIEVHWINDNHQFDFNFKKALLEKLCRTHYLVHAHGNSYSGSVNNIPDVIELTYIRKDCLQNIPVLNTTPLPIHNLDFSNNIHRPDHNLDFYPFVSK